MGRFNVVYQFDAFDGTPDATNVIRMRAIQAGAGSRGGTYHAMYDGSEVIIGFFKGDFRGVNHRIPGFEPVYRRIPSKGPRGHYKCS